MPFVRFATARALFESYPEVENKIGAAPTDHPPIDFAKGLLSSGKLADALTFCAYLLPRREAVWWACSSVRTLQPEILREDADGLRAAEAWVATPDEEHRQAALAIGTSGDTSRPATWLACAAGWSGGFETSGARQLPIPAYMTARAARIAVFLSAAKVGSGRRQSGMRTSIVEGIRLAENGLG